MIYNIYLFSIFELLILYAFLNICNFFDACSAVPDANYELASMLTEFGLWHIKRASYLASNERLV